jgi:hypothetical protein
MKETNLLLDFALPFDSNDYPVILGRQRAND